ncbi:hypothetical protein HN39_01900 [Listeria monocytogenes]|nr:hypothetical protein [Listeria monocytogenes]EAC6356318.1 hypothetical protein [Listeria monocytogenes]EAC7062847.1 hypothetical protein [Listeria monocytogenes]EAC7899125.1 hypothetical protein [Listeria monocytogenes]EAD7040750.1 hypothetical protein [Listeria monocytogenes]
MNELIMSKELVRGQVVRFYKIANRKVRYELKQGQDVLTNGPFPSLLEAVNHFKAVYRKRESINRKRTEEQELIDQFNAWDGDVNDMEGFTL